MSNEILIPFALSQSGFIAATPDPVVQTAQHVNSLVSTRPGERAMLPTYGVDLAGRVFGGESEVTAAIVNDVSHAMQAWEPSVTVRGVFANGTDPQTGMVQVEVDYVTPSGGSAGSDAAVSTATVLVGGAVIQQVSP